MSELQSALAGAHELVSLLNVVQRRFGHLSRLARPGSAVVISAAARGHLVRQRIRQQRALVTNARMEETPLKRLYDVPLDAMLPFMLDGLSRDALAAVSSDFNDCRVNNQACKERVGQICRLHGRIARSIKTSWAHSALVSLRYVAYGPLEANTA
jgi:hypothetical protein